VGGGGAEKGSLIRVGVAHWEVERRKEGALILKSGKSDKERSGVIWKISSKENHETSRIPSKVS